jgi:hypothetical protein
MASVAAMEVGLPFVLGPWIPRASTGVIAVIAPPDSSPACAGGR